MDSVLIGSRLALTLADFAEVPSSLHRQADCWPLVYERTDSRVWVRPASFTAWYWDADEDAQQISDGLSFIGVERPDQAHWIEVEYWSLSLLADVLASLKDPAHVALWDDHDGVWRLSHFVDHVRSHDGDRQRVFADFYVRRGE